MRVAESDSPRLNRSILLALIVFLLPAVIASIALWRLGGLGSDDAVRHVFVVACIAIASISLKALLARRARVLVRSVATLIITATWTALFGLQVGSLVAVASWGQLLTWPMTEAYLRQSIPMLDVLGFSAWFIGLFVLAAVLPLVLVSRLFGQAFDITWRPRGVSPALVDFGLGACFACSVILLGQWVAVSDRNDREPLSVFLSPEGTISVVQGWSVAPSPILEARERDIRRSYVPSVPSTALPNVILVVVDALRSDHLGPYGYGRRTSPYIDSWSNAPGAVVVPFSRAVCAESSCGLLALARSKHPWEVTSVDFTLYDALKAHGYRNYFYLSGDHTNFYGLRATYSPADLYVDSTEIDGAYLNDDFALIEAFKKAPRFDGTPTFLQFHLMSVHGLGSRRSEFMRFSPHTNPYRIHLAGKLPSEVDIERVVNFYDNGILQLDSVFEELNLALAEKGYLDDALVILTGDHGELLGESGLVTHARSTEEAVLATPLVVRRFREGQSTAFDPVSISTVASQVDVAPTILEAIGAPLPSTWSGISLQKQERSRVLFFAQGENRGLYDVSPHGIYKYTFDAQTGRGKVERHSGGMRFERTETVDEAERKRAQWQRVLNAEIGPGWQSNSGGQE